MAAQGRLLFAFISSACRFDAHYRNLPVQLQLHLACHSLTQPPQRIVLFDPCLQRLHFQWGGFFFQKGSGWL